MEEARLQDLIRRGLGRAARVAGALFDAYRPGGPDAPLAPERRFLRLNAAFSGPHGFRRPVGYGEALWHGIFDAAYTRTGDYLAGTATSPADPDLAAGIWFIAAQQSLAPMLCVRANRIASFARPAAPAVAGINGYGGVRASSATPLATGWPVSVLNAGGAGIDAAGLPADAMPGAWTVLLPAIDGVVFRPGDLMTDDLGRTAILAACELTDLGWRLLAKQATT